MGYEKTEDLANTVFNAESLPPYVEIPRPQSVSEQKFLPLKLRIEPDNEADRGKVLYYGSTIRFVDWYFFDHLVRLAAMLFLQRKQI